MKKIASKYYQQLRPFEQEYVHTRAKVDDISTIKLIINDARRLYPGYVKIFGKGFIELPSGETLLWSGRDTRRFVKVQKQTKQEDGRKQEIEAYLKHLQDTEVYDEKLEMSVWPDKIFKNAPDLSVTTCTSSSMLIAARFNGKVYGYHLDDEENSDIIGFDSGGHDFAIVGDYLVDYWGHYVEGVEVSPVLHLKEDTEVIKKYYLPRSKWETVPLWEKADSTVLTKQTESMHPLDQLKKQIKTQLDLCESQETPTVCAIKEDPDGYKELEKIIIDKVMYGDDISIANAIVEVENEFNANSYAE